MDEPNPAHYRIEAAELSEHLLGELARVYGAANDPNDDRTRRAMLFAQHANEPQWQAIIAGSPVVGFAYGFHCVPGQWWRETVYEQLRARLGRRRAKRWLADTCCLAELHVHPAWQRGGIGQALLTELSEWRTERTMVLSTPDRGSAHGFYRRLGFVELAGSVQFPGNASPYTVFGKSER
ncbi:MAG: GNAT family N-acetyltransferase [Streptosporangiales bacterium]|nr:GNAT family N-acetyltransferase [Streptosporangiales bacterium]